MDFLNNLAGDVLESVSKFGRGLSSTASEPMRIAGRELPRMLDPRRIVQDPKRLVNPLGVRGGILTGRLINAVGDKFGMPERDQTFLESAATAPGPAFIKPLVGLIAADLMAPPPAGGAIYNEDGTLTENAKAAQQFALAQGKPDPFGYRAPEEVIETPVPVDTREVVLPETRVETSALVSDPVPASVPVETQLETPREAPAPVVVQEAPKPQNALAQKFLEDQMIGNEMANTGELQDLLMRSGAVGGISEKDLDTWTRTNSALAYRLAEKEGLLSGI